jgi:hypothetical protein
MTVKELIDELQNCDPDAEILRQDPNSEGFFGGEAAAEYVRVIEVCEVDDAAAVAMELGESRITHARYVRDFELPKAQVLRRFKTLYSHANW